jgi:mannan endo-1,4-beta-mannosidase
VLTANGGRLMLGGQPYRDVGLNAYEIGTDWGVNAGCGDMLTDTQMTAFFASLPAHTLVRFWAWEGNLAVNIHTGQIDWTGLDRVFSAAAAHNDLLMVSLSGQGGGCDDNIWKDPAWFQGGYRTEAGTNSIGQALPLTFWQYVQAIVARYSSSPALGMWEPISEPEASDCPAGYSGDACMGHQTCPDEAAASRDLRGFYDNVGGEIHLLDPRHLVEAAFIGSGQCGTTWQNYQYVGASSGIDVLAIHDYYGADAAVGGDQWNGIAERATQARTLNKPLISGEVGIKGGPGSCPNDPARATGFSDRIQQQSAIGVSVFLFWNSEHTPASGCTYDIGWSDPTMALLGRF